MVDPDSEPDSLPWGLGAFSSRVVMPLVLWESTPLALETEEEAAAAAVATLVARVPLKLKLRNLRRLRKGVLFKDPRLLTELSNGEAMLVVVEGGGEISSSRRRVIDLRPG